MRLFLWLPRDLFEHFDGFLTVDHHGVDMISPGIGIQRVGFDGCFPLWPIDVDHGGQ